MELDELTSFAQEKLSAVLKRPVEFIELEGHYLELGADSMDLVALAFEVEKIVGREVDPEIFLRHDTILSALEEIRSDAGA